MLFSSTSADTANLPIRNNRDIVDRVFSSKRPQYSNLFFGAAKQAQIVTVEVPVFRDGEVIYDISFSPPIEIFQAMIEQQRPSRDWTISIFDSDGTNFARVPNPQETVGKRASPSLYAEMFKSPEATLSTISLEGVPLITSFARSSLTGWTVAAGVAESSLVAPLWRNLAITSVMGAVLLMVGLAFAVRMATQIARGEMLHNLLIEELNHRVKNTLAVLQSIATQTFRSASRTEREKFEGRLGALAEAHNLLSLDTSTGPPPGSGRPASSATAAGLSEREVEVLRLLAGGRSNAEIAAELVLSVRTVEKHVANIYAKIGARGRADAATYALRQGLLPTTP
jgi:DNA-binding NarL/FixJ family response regulator